MSGRVNGTSKRGLSGTGAIPRIAFCLMGFLALIWFLIRVIPKPSRALYPCQRAAFPLVSAFIISLFYMGPLSLAAGKPLRHAAGAKLRRLVLPLIIIAGLLVFTSNSPTVIPADTEKPVSVPIGEPKGIKPGRVAWVYDPAAAKWKGLGSGYWWQPENTVQSVVGEMLGKAVCSVADVKYSEKTDISTAWNSIFTFHNAKKGRGGRGYTKGEKIMIKVNFVGDIALWGGSGFGSPNYPNTSPQVIHAVLDQLVNRARVAQSDVTVGDTLCNFRDDFYRLLAPDFPEVNYLSNRALPGRIRPEHSSVPVYWSSPNAKGKRQDYLPASFAEATYLINIANLKGHFDVAGITLCAKNNYGSLYRRSDGEGGAYFNLHADNALYVSKPGSYRNLVDLMGHEGLGGKTVLYLIDGLYAARHSANVDSGIPIRWKSAPFNGGWTSSLFASLDPVAIDSVGFDFLLAEWPTVDRRELVSPASPGVGDYLVEAALANGPPSGVFYHPNDATPTKRLPSLGVSEHWKDPKTKLYSGNEGKKGIELVQITR
jgi:hypothetical protein